VAVHGLRGQPSNRRIGEKIQQKARKVLGRPDWHDFGPAFASERLAKRYRIQVSQETVRSWMIAAGLWRSRPREVRAVHCWRLRRSGHRELVQWDTSDPDWLEGRGERARYWVRMMDDATSRSWGALCHTMGPGRTWECRGSIWNETGGRRILTQTAIPCLRYRRGPERQNNSGGRRIG
jgi:hypothetical protein